MKKLFLVSLAVTVCCLCTVSVTAGDDASPVQIDKLAAYEFQVPQDLADRNYLGLSANGSFTIPQIKAKVVIIEIFSMYCPACQKEAPIVNELFHSIAKNPAAKDKLRLIGIGAGNSAFEVQVFKKTYNVLFPLLPDPNLTVHKICGEVRTPYFIGAKIGADRSLSLVYSQAGSFGDPDQFVHRILTLSGVKEE